MALNDLHFILTYRCTATCDHCFVYGEPSHSGVMTPWEIDSYIGGAKRLGTITSLWIDGGEPFLYTKEMLIITQLGVEQGFTVGALTNGYWAKSLDIARRKLEPLVESGLTALNVSTGRFHTCYVAETFAHNAIAAAETFNLKVSKTETTGERLMFRGRATERLAHQTYKLPWQMFDRCSHETLNDPRRVHLDRHGFLHLCQGLVMEGSAHEESLPDIVQRYDPLSHPIAGLLHEGGPTLLTHEAMRMGFVPSEEGYADACHLCYSIRKYLRRFYPELLRPDEVYGNSHQDRASHTHPKGHDRAPSLLDRYDRHQIR